MYDFTEDDLNDTEDLEIWCYDCGNEIPTCNGLCGICNHYRLLKYEDYTIYNPFWKNHFIDNGRLINVKTNKEKEKLLCTQAVNSIKTIQRFSKNKKFETSISDLVWLNERPPDKPEPVLSKKNIKISLWSDIFS